MKSKPICETTSCMGKDTGFSLIEVLVASLLLATILLAVGMIYPRGMSAISMGNCRAKAGNLAQKKLEELFEAAWAGDETEKLREGTYQDRPDPRFTRRWSIVRAEREGNLADLSVTVTWQVLDKERSVTLKSLVVVRGTDT